MTFHRLKWWFLQWTSIKLQSLKEEDSEKCRKNSKIAENRTSFSNSCQKSNSSLFHCLFLCAACIVLVLRNSRFYLSALSARAHVCYFLLFPRKFTHFCWKSTHFKEMVLEREKWVNFSKSIQISFIFAISGCFTLEFVQEPVRVRTRSRIGRHYGCNIDLRSHRVTSPFSICGKKNSRRTGK